MRVSSTVAESLAASVAANTKFGAGFSIGEVAADLVEERRYSAKLKDALAHAIYRNHKSPNCDACVTICQLLGDPNA